MSSDLMKIIQIQQAIDAHKRSRDSKFDGCTFIMGLLFLLAFVIGIGLTIFLFTL